MSTIFRVWIDVEEFNPETEEIETVAVDFGPSATFFSTDRSSSARELARELAIDFAERLQDLRPVEPATVRADHDRIPEDVAS